MDLLVFLECEYNSKTFYLKNSQFYLDHRLRVVLFLGPEGSSTRERILLAEPTSLSTIPEASSFSTEILFPCYCGERVCINLLVSHLSGICVWLYCCVHHCAVW